MTESSFGLNCSCINDFARLYLFILENLSLDKQFTKPTSFYTIIGGNSSKS
jgi:hypothetical protein